MNSSDKRDLSVEEILQSIRNVIHSTHTNNSNDSNRHTPEIYDDVLELTDEHHVSDTNDTLLDENAARDSSDMLRNFIERAESISDTSHKHSKTIEELVTDMLKPELSKWLNLHLPKIVRELVEQELKRIVPKNH